MPGPKELNPRQAAFVREYLIDRNGTQAAIRAGYSEKTAAEQSSRLLTYVNIKNAIKDGEAKHAERCAVTIESLTKELIADRKLARQIEQPSPAITATMSIAKLHGLDVNKNQNENTGAPVFVINNIYEK